MLLVMYETGVVEERKSAGSSRFELEERVEGFEREMERERLRS